MSKISLPKDKIRVLLLENIHENAAQNFSRSGYTNIERLDHALEGQALIDAVKNTHILGIRSRTKLTAEVLEHAQKLFCVGCFCIGTNQVDLKAARDKAIAVFNAPYSNTRSVAELVLGELVMLLRRTFEYSSLCHKGIWQKSAAGSFEVRGKTLGIVGYGHIGSQLSILAEAAGFNVIYYDIVKKLALGNARPVATLDDLLAQSDIVSLHVPATTETANMIGHDEISQMKNGAYLVNASRGNVVDIDALAAALDSKYLAGAAVDVFPVEPKSAEEEFVSPLRGKSNVILTPHIGGSTQEAQQNIGQEVAEKLAFYSDNGSTLGAVNFVELNLPVQDSGTRFLHIHRNAPGVLSKINDVFASRKLNITGQFLRTDGEIGYVVVDIGHKLESGMGIRRELEAIEGTLSVRFLF